jgi:DNA-binding response OmpR family regulator
LQLDRAEPLADEPSQTQPWRAVAASLNITVVEDHDDQRDMMVEALRTQGHRVVGLASAEALGVAAAADDAPDLFVIDLNLPGEDGLSLASRVRGAHPRAGIVMVTARVDATDRVSGYDHGADLYLSKPVSATELCAAVAALQRRLPAAGAAGLEHQPLLTLDRLRLRLTGPAAILELTPAEAALIEAMALAPRHRLGLVRIADVLGQPFEALNKASLEVRVVRLRRKLANAGAGLPAIKAVRGHGYQLCVAVLLT